MKDLVPGLEDTSGLRSEELSFLSSLEEAPAAEMTPEVEEAETTETNEEAPEVELEESTPEESADEEDASEEADLAIEFVETSDGKKVKIDYNDRDRVKRAHLLARQGRVWQAERDQARAELESMKPELEDLKGVVDALEAVKDDPAELYRLITGGENWEELIEKEIQQREEIAQLTPAQLDVYNKHKLAEKREAELLRKEEAWRRKLQDAENTKLEAEKNNQQALIKGAFNEYRFANTLGDPVLEHKLDRMVFNNIKAELNGKDMGDFEIRETIKRAFDDLRGSVNVASKKVAQKSRTTKVAQATKKAAENVNKPSNETTSVREKLAKGDITSILSMENWADIVNKL